MQPNDTTAQVLIDERQHEVAAHLQQLDDGWTPPTGFRGKLRTLAIRLRGEEQQVNLERIWRLDAMQRRNRRPMSGW